MAPTGEENTAGELVEEIHPHHEITQVPKLKLNWAVQFLGTVEPVHSHSKPERVFNFPRATPASYTSTTPTSAAVFTASTHSIVGYPSESTPAPPYGSGSRTGSSHSITSSQHDRTGL